MMDNRDNNEILMDSIAMQLHALEAFWGDTVENLMGKDVPDESTWQQIRNATDAALFLLMHITGLLDTAQGDPAQPHKAAIELYKEAEAIRAAANKSKEAAE